jgi:hypothetical protein
MSFEFEYLGEFTFKFENLLDPETGSQMGSIDEKKLRSKISCKCTFKNLVFVLYCIYVCDDMGKHKDYIATLLSPPRPFLLVTGGPQPINQGRGRGEVEPAAGGGYVERRNWWKGG